MGDDVGVLATTFCVVREVEPDRDAARVGAGVCVGDLGQAGGGGEAHCNGGFVVEVVGFGVGGGGWGGCECACEEVAAGVGWRGDVSTYIDMIVNYWKVNE